MWRHSQVQTLAALSTPSSPVVLGYRRRTAPATAAHFFHLLAAWFETPQPVGASELHPRYAAADVVVYRLRRRERRQPPAACAYCAMLVRNAGDDDDDGCGGGTALHCAISDGRVEV
jgi:hypothetical protein